MKNYIGQALSTLLLTVCLGSCNKISTEDQKSPFDFSGVESIQGSAGGSFILSWTPPKLIEIENYGVFLLALSADDAKSLIPADAKLAPDDKNPGVAVQTSPAFSPADHGKLISIVARDSNSFKTPVLDEGYYLLQVKVLAKDGRSDSSSKSILLQVRSADAFTGITLAQVDGADATLSWLPSPSIREGEKFQYTIYKGPAFNQAVGFTKDTTFSYPLNQEAAGSTIYFGVRFTDGQGQEDRNSVILPIKVPNLNDDFSGCLTATGVGSDRIRVDFQWPTSKSYQELKVFRNQREVFSSLSRSVTSFVDRELVEGEVYTYTCQAFDSTKAIMGSKAVKGSPLSSNAPTFAGIRNAAAQDGHTALLSWGVSKGVPAEAFKLYASQGPNLDWTAAPALSMEVSSLTGSITGLGDDLIYSFGVRACGALTCDPNTDQINLQMPDAGPPQSLGAESAVLDNGKILIHAPWSPKDGGISKRHIYVKVDGPSSAEIGDYTLAKTILVPAGSPVPETLVYDSIIAGKTYHLIVRDEDVHGQRNASVAFVSVVTGDLSPPEFNGISSLAVGPLLKEETALTVNFAAIKPYTEEIKGAKTYRFYLREGSAAACNETYYKLSLPGTSFAMGPATMVLTGLKPKTFYSVCVKVVDKYNNMSTNINYAARQTQDKTKPDFDGLQTLLYDIGRSEVNLTWNSSSSADIYEYKITTWLTSSPNPVMEISIARRASESPSSYALTSGLIGFKSEDNLEVVVNACDNASTIGGGTQNCTTFDRSKALKFTFADIQPPAGFLGISSLGAQLKPAAGSIQVTWIAPSSWTDYSGFKVYKVGDAESLTLLKDCPCAGVNCPDTITSCTITDLDHYRSYPLHVRAYDAKGNHTLLDPTLSVARVRTSDTQKPSFHSNLGLDFVSGATLLDWAAATDDQYALEPGVALTYHVYRKMDSNFANLLNPSVDGLLLTDTLTLNYIDSKDFITGKTYYYTVCVTDSSLNESCDGAFKSTTIPDLVPPVIASFASSKTTAGKTWNLTWSASDNITTTPNLLYRVKYRVSNDPLAVLTDADATIFTQIGASGQLNLVGPQNVDTYIHYLLTVTDGAGNAAKKQITLYSTNKVVVGSVNMNEGSTLGGKLLYIVGAGFHSSSVVTIGGSPCGSLQIISKSHLLCRSPAKTSGTYTLVVTNSDGSLASFANAYTACVPDSTCAQICNMPASWEPNFARSVLRGATELNPYIICTGPQLAKINTIGTGKYYALGDNIDLSTYTNSTWPGIASLSSGWDFQGFFDGKGFAVTNLTYSNLTFDVYGLFRRLRSGTKIKNLAVLNANVTARNYVGILSGASDNDPNILVEDVVTQGNATGSSRVGGIGGEFFGSLYRAYTSANILGVEFVGGMVGYKLNPASDLTFEGTVRSTGQNREVWTGGIFGNFDGNGGTTSNLVVNGTVRANDHWNVPSVGGIVGRLTNQTLKDSSFNGTVTAMRQSGGAIGYGQQAVLENVSVKGVVTGEYRVGGIIGTAVRVDLKNVSNEASVTATSGETGGLAGYMEGTSTTVHSFVKLGSRNFGNVIGTADTGGLIGRARFMEVLSSYNTGNVTSNGTSGGIIGWVDSQVPSPITIDQSYSTGNVTSTGDNVGGAIGYMNFPAASVITASFATGKVTGRTSVGGFCGVCYGTFKKSYATGDVSAPTSSYSVGGFMGILEQVTNGTVYSLIEDCYAKGKVTASVTGNGTGGFIGWARSYAKIYRSFASGDVSGFHYVGGFVGMVEKPKFTFEQNFALGKVSGLGVHHGGFAGLIGNSGLATDYVLLNNYARGVVLSNGRAGGFAGTSKAKISSSYATGLVDRLDSEAFFAGFVGVYDATSVSSNNLWDKTASTQNSSLGATGKTSVEMKSTDTFASYDPGVWSIKAGRYPRFNWEAGVTP